MNKGVYMDAFATIKNGAVEQINTTTGYREPVLENLFKPRNIAFHPTKNMFLVITEYGQKCLVYQVTN